MLKKLFLLTVLVVALPLSAYAFDCPGTVSVLPPLGYEQLTVSNSAVGLTVPAKPVRMAVVVVESNTIRFRDDGTNPTSTVGTPVVANVTILICGRAVDTFKAIRVSGDAVLNIAYYGQ
jgi:hypothetical protein